MKRKLKEDFFRRSTLKVAQELLGKYLVRSTSKKILAGKIVETEAYIGPQDKAAHSYNGKITKRNKVEYLKGGRCYIYLVYGMYWQLNITTKKEGKPECVLIRALEPAVASSRKSVQNNQSKKLVRIRGKLVKINEITNGPGKLCRWLKLDGSFYGEDLTKSKRLWLEDRGIKIKKSQIVRAKRIGIDYAEEWKEKLWRFYIKGNKFVSKR